jgi:RHS repeat-associated protein
MLYFYIQLNNYLCKNQLTKLALAINLNKGISLVTYNHLNQPVEVRTGTNKTLYTYTSTGLKLACEEWVNGLLNKKTEYSGAFVYENAQLSYINIPDGRYVVATGKYEYNLTDHLGNVHATFTKSATGTAELIQEDHYYPFGLQMSGQHFENTTFLNKYLYNGKEKQTQTGYYDYGFRQLDPQLCRWHVVDAMAEKYLSTSPYAYVENNPISFKDYMGLFAFPVYINGVLDHYVYGDGGWESAHSTLGGGGGADLPDRYREGGGSSLSFGLSINLPDEKFGQYRRGWSGHGPFLHGFRALFSWFFSGVSWDISTVYHPGYFEVGPVIGTENFVKHHGMDCGSEVSEQLAEVGVYDYNEYEEAYNSKSNRMEYDKILIYTYLAKGNIYGKKPGPTSNEQVQNAIDYIVNQIDQGRPVKGMAQYTDDGVYDNSSNKNPDGSDHSIAIVGYGIDEYGFYIRFFDNGTKYPDLGTDPSNRLYYINGIFTIHPDNPTLMNTDDRSFSQYTIYILTHVRLNRP